MTYNEYWNEDALLVKYYRESYHEKLRQKDRELWLQGMYIYEALIKVSPILHAFSKAGTKPEPYSKKPYGIFDNKEKNEDEEIKKQKEIKKQLEIEKAQIFFKNWAKANKKVR